MGLIMQHFIPFSAHLAPQARLKGACSAIHQERHTNWDPLPYLIQLAAAVTDADLTSAESMTQRPIIVPSGGVCCLWWGVPIISKSRMILCNLKCWMPGHCILVKCIVAVQNRPFWEGCRTSGPPCRPHRQFQYVRGT